MDKCAPPSTASTALASIPYMSKQFLLQEKEEPENNSPKILYPHQEASLPVHPSSQTLCPRCSKFATRLDCHLPCSDKTPFLKHLFLEEIEGVSETTSKTCRLCKFWIRLHHPDQDHFQLSASYHWALSTYSEKPSSILWA